ncbi:MAG: hypothetical protein ACO1O1_17550 [Adhaeribacter sp.]
MRRIVYVLTFLSFFSCSLEKNEVKLSNEIITPKSNKQTVETKAEEKLLTRKKRFNLFLKKFKIIPLPFKHRISNNLPPLSFPESARLDKSSSDTLFVKAEYLDESFRYGMLSDTTIFYSLIFFFPADDFYPVLATYTKSGKLISQKALTVNGCGSDCGLTYCSQTVILDKYLSIRSADSIRYDFHCDDYGNLMKDSGLLIVESKTGQVNKNGRIIMGKEVRSEKKLPTTLPKKH